MSIGNIDFLPYPPVWLEKTDQTLEEIEEIPEKELDEYIEAYEFGEELNEAVATELGDNEKLSYEVVEKKVRRERKIKSPKNYKQRELVNTSREEYLRRMNNLRYIR